MLELLQIRLQPQKRRFEILHGVTRLGRQRATRRRLRPPLAGSTKTQSPTKSKARPLPLLLTRAEATMNKSAAFRKEVELLRAQIRDDTDRPSAEHPKKHEKRG